MTEIIYQAKEAGCELWQKAKNLAAERGFVMSDACPLVESCTGEHCLFIQKEAEKLEALRQELKNLNGKI